MVCEEKDSQRILTAYYYKYSFAEIEILLSNTLVREGRTGYSIKEKGEEFCEVGLAAT